MGTKTSRFMGVDGGRDGPRECRVPRGEVGRTGTDGSLEGSPKNLTKDP